MLRKTIFRAALAAGTMSAGAAFATSAGNSISVIPVYFSAGDYQYISAINDAATAVGPGYRIGYFAPLNGNGTPGTFEVVNDKNYFVMPAAINATGLIAGTTAHQFTPKHAIGFVYDSVHGGSATLFTPPNAYERSNLIVYGVNATGQVVGSYSTDRLTRVGFIYANGNFAVIAVPGARSTEATAINDNGVVTGTYVDSTGLGRHGFVKASSYSTADMPGVAYTNIIGINKNGVLLGYGSANAEPLGGQPFLYNGSFTPIPLPAGATSSVPVGFNNNGQIVGYYFAASQTVGWEYDSTNGLTLFPAFGVDELPVAINDSGLMVGALRQPHGAQETIPFWACPPNAACFFGDVRHPRK